MKTLLPSLLLACSLIAAGQQTEIIALDPATGILTWTNPTTNVYCGLE